MTAARKQVWSAESYAAHARFVTEDLLRPVRRDRRGSWTADYVRLRVEAVKK